MTHSCIGNYGNTGFGNRKWGAAVTTASKCGRGFRIRSWIKVGSIMRFMIEKA